MWHVQLDITDQFAASDACLIAAGGRCEQECFKVDFPAWLLNYTNNIAHLEMIALIVTLKVWIHKMKGKSLIFNCDNMAVCHCVNSGLAKDEYLLQCLRELSWLCVTNEFYIRLQYIESAANLIPDLLSRYSSDWKARRKFHKLNEEIGLKQVTIKDEMFNFVSSW